MNQTNSHKRNNPDLSWILVSILAALAICYFFLEGKAQSTTVIAVLLIGLIAITVSTLKK